MVGRIWIRDGFVRTTDLSDNGSFLKHSFLIYLVPQYADFLFYLNCAYFPPLFYIKV